MTEATQTEPESDNGSPCKETSRQILQLLKEQQKLLRAHSEFLKGYGEAISQINANIVQVVEHQKATAQHLGSLERRYAQLECMQPRRSPSAELKAVGDPK
jgi:hypothetical protein